MKLENRELSEVARARLRAAIHCLENTSAFGWIETEAYMESRAAIVRALELVDEILRPDPQVEDAA